MIITPKEPRDKNAVSSLSKLVPYMLRGKGEERCTWYVTGNLGGLHRREDAELAVEVMELLQEGNVRAKGDRTYHLVISFHPEDRRLTPAELENVVRRAVEAAGLEEHQYIAVRHSEQEHEHLHVAVNQIHPETLKIHHPYKAIHAYQALASVLEEELGLHRVDRAKSPTLSYRARNFEAHHGLESFSRWARRSIGDATDLDRLRSWEALHEELTRFGVRLVRRGNGLALVDATRPNLACKASALGRAWSKQRLAERYGEFVPGRTAAEVARDRDERVCGTAPRASAGRWALARVSGCPWCRTGSAPGAPRGVVFEDRCGPSGTSAAFQAAASCDCRHARFWGGQTQTLQAALVREEGCGAKAWGEDQGMAVDEC